MTADDVRAGVTTIATFPPHYFLENLAVRTDGSILVSALNHKQVWWVPAPAGDSPAEPVLVHTFDDGFPMAIVEADPDVFYVCTALEGSVHRLDLRGLRPGDPVPAPRRILTFPESGVALNGACLIGPRTILAADCLHGAVRRIDLADDGLSATTRVWLADPTMTPDPDNGLTSVMGPQPGVNGIRHDRRTSTVYYSATARQVFVRVPVDPDGLDPAGPAELVASGIGADDFCLDEDAGVAYLTTHADNTILRADLDPDGGPPVTVAGEPFCEQLVGPSSAAWGRAPGDRGRIAYVTTDGGHTAATYGRAGNDGVVRPARVLRVDLRPGG